MKKCLTTLVLFVAGAAMAMAPVDYTNPGYQFGRTNCGLAQGVRRFSSCVRCCSKGALMTHYPADEGFSCRGFCVRAYWPAEARRSP